MAESDIRSSRDTRLLVLVIAIALAVLFVLARFRFPEAEVRPSVPTTGLLDRIVVRSTYDELATAVQTTVQRASSGIVMLDLALAPSKTPRAREGGPEPQPTLRVAAVRISSELAIAAMPQGYAVVPGGESEVAERGADPARGIVVAYVKPRDAADRPPAPATDFQGYKYVAVVEPAAGGPTGAPAFIGRIDYQVDERWGGDLLVPGGSLDLPAGSLVYTLDNRFVGMVISWADGSRRIVPAALLAQTMGGGAGGDR